MRTSELASLAATQKSLSRSHHSASSGGIQVLVPWVVFEVVSGSLCGIPRLLPLDSEISNTMEVGATVGGLMGRAPVCAFCALEKPSHPPQISKWIRTAQVKEYGLEGTQNWTHTRREYCQLYKTIFGRAFRLPILDITLRVIFPCLVKSFPFKNKTKPSIKKPPADCLATQLYSVKDRIQLTVSNMYLSLPTKCVLWGTLLYHSWLKY